MKAYSETKLSNTENTSIELEKMEEILVKAMASVKNEEVLHDFRPFLVIYKDGSVQRFLGTLSVPSSVDSVTGTQSKDVVINPETGVYVRLYKPQGLKAGAKVPLLVYFHGGGFCVGTASSTMYHNYLNALSSKAKVVVVSVSYRLAPEHPLPTVYDDSWDALEWVGKGAPGDKNWLSEHADMNRVYMAGDSAGANITHHMAKRFKKDPIKSIALKGIVLVHPYFWGKDRIGSELPRMIVNRRGPPGSIAEGIWTLICPGTNGTDDPLINPAMDPELAELGVEKVLVCVAEHDALRDRGVYYKKVLLKSGWKGDVELVETFGENHVFHLIDPASPKSLELMDHFAAFLNSTYPNYAAELYYTSCNL